MRSGNLFYRALAGLSLLAILLAAPPAGADTSITGGSVKIIAIATGITGNATSTAVEMPNGAKSIVGQVVCTSGACVQTQAIYGDRDNDAANGILLCTLTLTATTRDDDACPVITAAFSYYYVITTATSGTSATGAVYAMY